MALKSYPFLHVYVEVVHASLLDHSTARKLSV